LPWLSRLGNPLAVVVAMIALLMATLNVNVAANVVSPQTIFPISTAAHQLPHGGFDDLRDSILMQPWKLLANYGSYIFGWLVGYSGFLGPIAGVPDLRLLRAAQENHPGGRPLPRGSFYEFSGGITGTRLARWRRAARWPFIGLVYPPLRVLYDYAWFLGFAVSFTVYCALMSARQKRAVRVQPPALSED